MSIAIFRKLKKIKQIVYSLLFLWGVISASSADAFRTKQFETTPVLNNGKKWRIGYYEGGPYASYQESLVATVKALMEAGWIDKAELPKPPDPQDSSAIWRWLAKKSSSDFIRFEETAFWSADWNNERRNDMKQTVLKILSSNPELDMIFAMGTWAGQDLAVKDHSVPVIVMSSSDPLQAGIVKSYKTSGYDHVFAKCAPHRYIRQIRLFHNLFGFKKLGIIYNGTPAGEIYANLPDAKKVAEERGFEIELCVAPQSDSSDEKFKQNVSLCFEKLASKIDAMYISDINGIQARYMPEIIEPLLQNKVPVWSAINNIEQVRRGALLSVVRNNYDEIGRFYLNIIAQIFNGAKPGELDQIFDEPFKLAINLAVAKRIGYTPPKNILNVAEAQFTEIESGPME